MSLMNMPIIAERLCDALTLDEQHKISVAQRLGKGESLSNAFAAVAEEVPLAQASAQVLGLRFIARAAELIPELSWLTKIPLRVWASARAIPLTGTNAESDALIIAVADPFDATALDTIRVASGGHIPEIVVVPRSILHGALREHLGVGADTVQSLVEGKDEEINGREELAQGDLADSVEAAQDASIIRLVNQVLQEALERRATDVHFEPFEGRFAVRYRVDGELVEAKLPAEVRRLQAAIVSRLKILASLDIAEKRLPQDGRIKLRLSGRDVDVRVSIIPMLHGEAVVLRLLDRSAALVGLAGTGMGERDTHIFQQALALPHGIVLITGPTGSGKTTTLYAGLAKINTPELKIVTIEDPVEYHLDGINQIQVDTRTGLTFAKGLRAILRHDPDVVLIGEIRDRETAEIAVQASLTGHLVLSTLHTNDAPGAVTRLVDMGIEPYLVASTLELTIAQRLVRLLCTHCKQPVHGADYDNALSILDNFTGELFGPVGCRHCNGTGFHGRCAIVESMPMNDTLRHAAGERAATQKLRELAINDGMISLRADGLRLVKEGRTSLAEVLRNTR
jgi:general secretion pathway protein E